MHLDRSGVLTSVDLSINTPFPKSPEPSTKQERVIAKSERRAYFVAMKARGVPEFEWHPCQSGYAGPIVMQANR